MKRRLGRSTNAVLTREQTKRHTSTTTRERDRVLMLGSGRVWRQLAPNHRRRMVRTYFLSTMLVYSVGPLRALPHELLYQTIEQESYRWIRNVCMCPVPQGPPGFCNLREMRGARFLPRFGLQTTLNGALPHEHSCHAHVRSPPTSLMISFCVLVVTS